MVVHSNSIEKNEIVDKNSVLGETEIEINYQNKKLSTKRRKLMEKLNRTSATSPQAVEEDVSNEKSLSDLTTNRSELENNYANNTIHPNIKYPFVHYGTETGAAVQEQTQLPCILQGNGRDLEVMYQKLCAIVRKVQTKCSQDSDPTLENKIPDRTNQKSSKATSSWSFNGKNSSELTRKEIDLGSNRMKSCKHKGTFRNLKTTSEQFPNLHETLYAENKHGKYFRGVEQLSPQHIPHEAQTLRNTDRNLSLAGTTKSAIFPDDGSLTQNGHHMEMVQKKEKISKSSSKLQETISTDDLLRPSQVSIDGTYLMERPEIVRKSKKSKNVHVKSVSTSTEKQLSNKKFEKFLRQAKTAAKCVFEKRNCTTIRNSPSAALRKCKTSGNLGSHPSNETQSNEILEMKGKQMQSSHHAKARGPRCGHEIKKSSKSNTNPILDKLAKTFSIVDPWNVLKSCTDLHNNNPLEVLVKCPHGLCAKTTNLIKFTWHVVSDHLNARTLYYASPEQEFSFAFNLSEIIWNVPKPLNVFMLKNEYKQLGALSYLEYFPVILMGTNTSLFEIGYPFFGEPICEEYYLLWFTGPVFPNSSIEIQILLENENVYMDRSLNIYSIASVQNTANVYLSGSAMAIPTQFINKLLKDDFTISVEISVKK